MTDPARAPHTSDGFTRGGGYAPDRAMLRTPAHGDGGPTIVPRGATWCIHVLFPCGIGPDDNAGWTRRLWRAAAAVRGYGARRPGARPGREQEYDEFDNTHRGVEG